MSGLDELLPLYALGLLDGDEATQVETLLASSRRRSRRPRISRSA
jgi:hypothetical protein